MPNNISGVGVVGQRVAGELHMTRAFTFSAAEEKTFDEAKAYPVTDCAPLQDVDVSEKENSMTVTLGTQSLDEQSINWILFNNREQSSASIVLPNVKSATIIGGVISDADLALDQIVEVTLLSDSAPGNMPLTQQPDGTGVTATTFEVSTGQINFDASLNGKQAVYYYRSTYTTKPVVGGNTPYNPYTEIEIFGKICGTRFAPMRVWFPRCTSLSGMNLDPKADEFTREYKALVPFELGFVVPYVKWVA